MKCEYTSANLNVMKEYDKTWSGFLLPIGDKQNDSMIFVN